MIPLERKTVILEDAKTRILEGWTLYQIAEKHGITSRTLSTWLHQLGDEYTELRQVWIDNMLLEAKESLDKAEDTFPLARAREQWKAATWYAERRDAQRYGQKIENKQDLSISVTIQKGIAQTPVIQGDYEVITDELRKELPKPA